MAHQGSNPRLVRATLTTAAAGDYADNDVIGNDADDTEGDPLTLSGFCLDRRVVTVRRILAICSEDSIVATLRLHFFDTVPTAAEVEMDDNAAFAINTAGGAGKYLGFIDLAAFEDVGGVSMSQNNDLYVPMRASASDAYLVVQATAAEANETAGMTIRFDIYVE